MDAAKRSRLNGLTTKMQGNIDDADAQLTAINTAITQAQADIDALVALTNRSAAQAVELRCLRREIDLMRLCRSLIRNDVVAARFTLFVAGRSRQSDLTGSE